MPIYMKVQGIEGDVVAAGHKGWIELQSCRFGGQSSLKAGNQDILVTKGRDSSSPLPCSFVRRGWRGNPKSTSSGWKARYRAPSSALC